jgi:hypothetical protein
MGMWDGLTKIDPAKPHLDVVSSRPGSNPESFNPSGYADPRAAEIKSERPNTYALAEVKTHAEFIAFYSDVAEDLFVLVEMLPKRGGKQIPPYAFSAGLPAGKVAGLWRQRFWT